jgi:uncharacterized membrane protein
MNATPTSESPVPPEESKEFPAPVVPIAVAEDVPKAYPLPPKRPPGQNQSIEATAKYERFEGPMPPPQLLAHYESICPGAADRMLRMAEHEAEHRRQMETKIVDAQIQHNNKQFSEARCGQICALSITLAALAAGVYTAVNGHEIAGSIIGVGGIGGIVTTFIFGRVARESPDQDESTKPESKTNAPKSTIKGDATDSPNRSL